MYKNQNIYVFRKYTSEQVYTYGPYIHKLDILKVINDQTLKTLTLTLS
jgi:hypothetical protein